MIASTLSPSLHRYQAPLPASSSRFPEPFWVRTWRSGPVSLAETEFNRKVTDDAMLVRRVAQGDDEAAHAIVERLKPTVIKAVRRRMPRWASEDDLVQTVFAKVFSKLHQYSGAVPLECWVTRIALNTSLNQIAHESVRPEWRMSDLDVEQQQAIQNRAETSANEGRDDSRELIEVLLAHLRPDERQIITLLHIEQRSTKEISRMTGLSIALIKVKAFRTRRKMRRLGERLMR